MARRVNMIYEERRNEIKKELDKLKEELLKQPQEVQIEWCINKLLYLDMMQQLEYVRRVL